MNRKTTRIDYICLLLLSLWVLTACDQTDQASVETKAQLARLNETNVRAVRMAKGAGGIIAEQQEGATRRYEVTAGTYAFEVN